MGKAIEDGAAGTTLVSITVEAVAAGNSNVKMSNITIDDDHGGYINPDSPTAQLVVKQGGIAVTTTVPAANITGTPTVSTTTGVMTSSTAVKTPTTLLTTAQTPVEISVTSNIPSDPSVTAATPASLIAKFPRWMLYAAGLIALVAGLSSSGPCCDKENLIPVSFFGKIYAGLCIIGSIDISVVLETGWKTTNPDFISIWQAYEGCK